LVVAASVAYSLIGELFVEMGDRPWAGRFSADCS